CGNPGSAAISPVRRPRLCVLRNWPSLLDTRIQFAKFALMSVSGLLLFCFAGLIAAHELRAESTVAERDRRSAPAESRVTFSSVHVNRHYMSITFDDASSATLTPQLL